MMWHSSVTIRTSKSRDGSVSKRVDCRREQNGNQATNKDHKAHFLTLKCSPRTSSGQPSKIDCTNTPRKREMGRNLKILFNFEPPVTEERIRAASLQFVRKVSGFNKPSKANEAAFLSAVEEIAAVSSSLLSSLETN